MNGISMVSYNFQGMLAQLTETKARSWKEFDGPDSGCGMDYWYDHSGVGEAYINLDQGWLTISVNDEVVYEGDPREDKNFQKFVETKE